MRVTPYARKGELWNAHRRHFGQDGDPVLCWHAATRSMNPQVPQSVVDLAMARDPAHASGGIFRGISHRYRELHSVDRGRALLSRGIEARPYLSSCRYKAFIDPSEVRTTACASPWRTRKATRSSSTACLKPNRRSSPASVVRRLQAVLKQFRIKAVEGDRYGGEWCKEPFRKAGIAYEPASWQSLICSRVSAVADQRAGRSGR